MPAPGKAGAVSGPRPSVRRRSGPCPPPARGRLCLGLFLFLCLAGLLVSGCGDRRSAQAFCQTFHSQSATLGAKYRAAAQDSSASQIGTLNGLATVVGVPGDLLVMFTAMDKRAPDDIEPSVAGVIDSLKREEDALGSGSILTTLVGGLAASLTSSGAWQNVNNYISRNCGRSADE